MENNNETRRNFIQNLKVDNSGRKEKVPKKTENIKIKSKTEGTSRKNIKPGIKVKIVQKHHQKTGELTEGIVKDILTNSQNHHRGIKVRLESGIVGRIQEILN